MTELIRYRPVDAQAFGWLLRVGPHHSALRTHRWKAASGIPLLESGQSAVRTPDPISPFDSVPTQRQFPTTQRSFNQSSYSDAAGQTKTASMLRSTDSSLSSSRPSNLKTHCIDGFCKQVHIPKRRNVRNSQPF
ncbi:hypothetical protein [Paraburkholderia sp. BL6665CI2N2]|uniref:hypothetical protein n=1 Tax=Paraburkholderia sp. BL6665CI2N2 TaxID=1938806 RepID=UPI001416FE87|nr:hypothetical protein [Paraburkholderia sp. BL6665CI2N2]